MCQLLQEVRLIGQEALSDLEEKETKTIKLERNYNCQLKAWRLGLRLGVRQTLLDS